MKLGADVGPIRPTLAQALSRNSTTRLIVTPQALSTLDCGEQQLQWQVEEKQMDQQKTEQATEHGFTVKLTLLSLRTIGPYRATAELPLYRLYR